MDSVIEYVVQYGSPDSYGDIYWRPLKSEVRDAIYFLTHGQNRTITPTTREGLKLLGFTLVEVLAPKVKEKKKNALQKRIEKAPRLPKAPTI